MSSITGLIFLILLAIMHGKRTKRVGLLGYLITALIAFAQVIVVFYFMMTMPYPTL